MKSMDVIAGRYLVVKGPAEDRTLKGGFGAVYLCADQRDEGRPVALKTFQPQFLSDRATRDRFLREADIWVRLGRHPHIVRAHNVLHVGDGREVYVVMDWVAAADGKKGASLREWLTPGRPVDAARALTWALQIVRAMKHATTIVPGLVHRDLKPENVLVGRDERAQVTDFGLARMVAETGRAETPPTDAASGSRAGPRHVHVTAGGGGTPPYMAPEQFDAGAIDLRADVYALGCLVVEMLTGEMPVRATRRDTPADTYREYRALHRAGRALAVADAAPDVRPWLERCLAVRAEGRYPTWDEVEVGLTAVYTSATGQVAPSEVTTEQDTREERVAAGWSLNAIGSSYLDIGQLALAADYFERARHSGSEEHEPALEFAAVGNLGTAYQRVGEVRRAINYHEQGLAIARDVGSRAGEGMALGSLGCAYQNLGEVPKAIGYFEQHLRIARDVGDQAVEGAALGNLGNAYLLLGEVQRAIDFFERCLAITRESNDRAGEGRTLGNLGSAYRALGEVRKAISYHEQRLAIARELADHAGEGVALNNLGIAHQELGEVRKSIGYLGQSVAIARDVGNRAGEGRALNNLANAYLQLGEVQRAIDSYEQRLAIAREAGDRMGEAIASLNLAFAFRQDQEPHRARQFAEVAARSFREIGHAEYVQRADQLLRQLGEL